MSLNARFGDLDGSVALVTGCGDQAGIGYAAARLLGRQGAHIAVAATTDRIKERGAELIADGIEASVHIADLTVAGEAQRIVDETVEHHGRIDILVNNAGMAQIGTEA